MDFLVDLLTVHQVCKSHQGRQLQKSECASMVEGLHCNLDGDLPNYALAYDVPVSAPVSTLVTGVHVV